MARANASPPAMSASTPANTSVSSRECDAPPNPVCGAPVGMTPVVPRFEVGPVDPPAPGAEPVRPVAPEPPGVTGVTPGVTPPAAGVPVVPDPPVPDPPVPDVGVVPVVVADGARKGLKMVVVQVTVLPPPLEEPLH